MKRSQFLVICVLAMSAASADSWDSPPQRAPSATTAPAQPSQSVLGARWQRGRKATRAGLAHLKADVVKDMRATSAFVREQATKASAPNGWLNALAGFGLVMVQLRRKHKSLPQRRIAPYC